MRKIFSSRLGRLFGLYIATTLFLVFTDPSKLPSFFLIVPFVAIFFCLYLTIMYAANFFRSGDDETIVGLPVRRPRVLAAVFAGFPVLLLILQSVVQLTIWDLIIAFAIFLLVYIYVSRSNVTFRGR